VASYKGGWIALRSRDFRYLAAGQLLSLTGSQMQQVAVVWQLYLLTHSPLALGLLGLFRVLPVVLFALWGGAIADAFDRRRLMLVSQSLMATVSLLFTVATYLGWASPYLTYGLSFFAGAALAVDSPARQALLPALVPREQLANALSVYFLVWQISTVIGPPLAGLLLAKKAIVTVYAVDTVSFIAVLAALLALKHRAPLQQRAEISIRSVLEGLSFIRRTPLIYTMMLLDFFATFLGGSMLLMPIFADQVLKVGAQGLGILYAAQPVGAALAAAVLSTVRLPRRQGATVLWAVAAYGMAIALFGLSPYFWLSLLALAISGAADSVSAVVRQTLRQLLTPDPLRGRMSSVSMIFFIGGPQLGEVEAGMVAKAFGARVSVASGGLLCVVAAAIVAIFVPALRRYQAGQLTAPQSGIPTSNTVPPPLSP
jgi:MFS family permease